MGDAVVKSISHVAGVRSNRPDGPIVAKFMIGDKQSRAEHNQQPSQGLSALLLLGMALHLWSGGIGAPSSILPQPPVMIGPPLADRSFLVFGSSISTAAPVFT